MSDTVIVPGGTPPPRRRRWPLVLGAVGLALLACCIGVSSWRVITASLTGNATNAPSGHAADSADGGANGAGAANAPAVTGLGQSVRDGKFSFVVHSVSCGHPSIGTQWFHAEAKGQFCLVALSVANIGTEAQRFADGIQQAYGPQGQLYAADTGAGVVANGNGDAVWSVVNPGNALDATVVYDIPPGSSIVSMRLHDSALSRGVAVQVAPQPSS